MNPLDILNPFDLIGEYVKRLVEGLLDKVQSVILTLRDIFVNAFLGVVGGLGRVVQSVTDAIRESVQIVVDGFEAVLKFAVGGLNALASTLIEALARATQEVRSLSLEIIFATQEALASALRLTRSFTIDSLSFVSNTIDRISERLRAGFAALSEALSDSLAFIEFAIEAMGDKLIDTLRTLLTIDETVLNAVQQGSIDAALLTAEQLHSRLLSRS